MPPLSSFFSQFFYGMGRAFSQTKFLAVALSLGHLSMKKVLGSKIRQSRMLALKLDKGRVLGGGNHPPWTSILPIFLTMKMTFNLNKL